MTYLNWEYNFTLVVVDMASAIFMLECISCKYKNKYLLTRIYRPSFLHVQPSIQAFLSACSTQYTSLPFCMFNPIYRPSFLHVQPSRTGLTIASCSSACSTQGLPFCMLQAFHFASSTQYTGCRFCMFNPIYRLSLLHVKPNIQSILLHVQPNIQAVPSACSTQYTAILFCIFNPIYRPSHY